MEYIGLERDFGSGILKKTKMSFISSSIPALVECTEKKENNHGAPPEGLVRALPKR